MSKMLERVAVAIGMADGYVSKPVMRERFAKAARAAIEAMLEPTDAVLAGYVEEDGSPRDAYDAWQAMINAALSDTKEQDQ